MGEVLGDEILPMLNAMSQGRSGSMCTIHADSSAGVFRRIASYAVQAPERLPLEATNLLVAGAIHFVVFLDFDLGAEDQSICWTDDQTLDRGSLGDHWDRIDAETIVRRVDAADYSSFPSIARRHRFVSSVREVVDAEGPHVISNEIYAPGPNRPAVLASPLRSNTAEELARVGRCCIRPPRPGSARMMSPGVLICGVVFAVGLLGLVSFVGRQEPDRKSDGEGAGSRVMARTQRQASSRLRTRLPKVALAGVVGLLSGLATGWLVACPDRRSGRLRPPRPVWENQRLGDSRKDRGRGDVDRNAARHAGGFSRIESGHRCHCTPLPVSDSGRDEIRLAALLEAGAQPKEALLRFAEEVADPRTDRVVCVALALVSIERRAPGGAAGRPRRVDS